MPCPLHFSCVCCQVFEFLDSDLEALIKAKGVVLSPADVKAYMWMLLQALDACHKHWVLHRDVKPNNMLISRDGEQQQRASAGGTGCRTQLQRTQCCNQRKQDQIC